MRLSPEQGASRTSATTIAGAKAVTYDGMIGSTKWVLPAAFSISESKGDAPRAGVHGQTCTPQQARPRQRGWAAPSFWDS
jgi:hypothetical protein